MKGEAEGDLELEGTRMYCLAPLTGATPNAGRSGACEEAALGAGLGSRDLVAVMVVVVVAFERGNDRFWGAQSVACFPGRSGGWDCCFGSQIAGTFGTADRNRLSESRFRPRAPLLLRPISGL